MSSLTFGTRLRQLRQRANLTGYALAKMTKLSRSYISELENGKKEPSLRVAVKLASALGVGVEEFTKEEKK